MPNVGWGELIVLLLVALIVFGPKRLPDMMKSLGKGIRAFQDETTRAVDTLREATGSPLGNAHGVIDRPDGAIGATEPVGDGAASEPRPPRAKRAPRSPTKSRATTQVRAAKSASPRSSTSRTTSTKVQGRPSRSRAKADGSVRAEAHEDT